ncbi:amidohydrolase family protein [Amycolatopsis tolypomycina]|uniref:amidohydrolase family protein n=1 Tax=Amycolatopsis tolypomycina TaxID=208445 RepID=UPI001FC9A822|nr:amidohydrolase family protein [Amycolatopsis tolypomycina]
MLRELGAAAQAARTGWAKVLADWRVGGAGRRAAGPSCTRALVAAGVTPHDALAAASWSAREYLGLGGLEPGAPADAVVYDRDPRGDPDQLADPAAVVLRGRCVRRR